MKGQGANYGDHCFIMDMDSRPFVKRIRQEIAVLAEPDFEEAISRVRQSYENDGFQLTDAQDEQLNLAADLLRSELEQRIRYLGKPSILTAGHTEAWYGGPPSDSIHWPAFQQYLRSEKNWDEDTVHTITESSEEIVSRLGNPAKAESFVKGLVVGHV